MQKLRTISKVDSRVKVIVNTRNFGHIRSPYWGILQTRGDATIYLASDLQDPPELIFNFIAEWEKGYKIVLGIKPLSKMKPLMHYIRRIYYKIVDSISEVPIVKDATGFGLYDKVVIDKLREINDPYPFLRGLICELGYGVKTVNFEQPQRMRGISKNNFYTLFDIAMLGVISHSRVPIRIATILGFLIGALSIFFGIFYFIWKILHWNEFPLGIAPIIILIFFLFGMLFIFIGIVGEYISSIHTYIRKRPIVVERERINFE